MSTLIAPQQPEQRKLRPHALQSAAYYSEKKFVGLACGRGSGKSELAKMRVVRALAETTVSQNPIYFYLLPTEPQAKRVAWKDLIARVPRKWVKRANIVDRTIETHFGSTLYVLGGDAPQRLEGVQWDGGIVDEACDYRPGVFNLSILPACTHRCRFLWRIGVPKRTGTSAKEFREWYFKPSEDKFCASWPSSDIVPSDILARIRGEMSRPDYEEQFEASWLNAQGGVYSEFRSAVHVHRGCVYDPRRPVVVGCDFNVSPMSWVLAHYVAGHIVVFDEVSLNNTTTQRALDYLYSKYPDHNAGWVFTGDAASKHRSTAADTTDYLIISNDPRFANKSVIFPDSNPSLSSRHATVNAALMSADGVPHVWVSPRCEQLIRDFESQAYKPNSSDVDMRDKTIGHMADGFGYMAMHLRPLPVIYDGADSGIYTAVYGYGNYDSGFYTAGE